MVRILCLSIILLALVLGFVALAPNLANDTSPVIANRETPADALEELRKRRSEVYDIQFEQLTSIMSDESVDDDIRLDAGTMRLRLIDNMASEVTVEGTLIARGFEDVVCTVNEDSVNVLVRAISISKSQLAMIMELTMRETGQSASNIKIIPVA